MKRLRSESVPLSSWFAMLWMVLPAARSICSQTPTEPYKGTWEEPHAATVCKAALARPLELPVPSGPLPQARLPDCDETKLYFGLGDAPNYPAALQCGLFQRAHPDPTRGDIFQGPGVLSMLYANGSGVQRNLPLAIRFACENSWSSDAGRSLQLGDLEHREADPSATTKPFSLCDNETSGLAEGNCAALVTGTADTARAKKLAQLVESLPAAAREDFPRLQAAQNTFATTRSGKEVDLSGTGREAFLLEERRKLNDQFLLNLRQFVHSRSDAGKPAELATLDAQLNSTYRHLLVLPASAWADGTVTPAGIQQTERAWLALVEAYLRFVSLANPAVSLTGVKIELWKLRLHQLRSLEPQEGSVSSRKIRGRP